ncbi:MAG: DUF2628 domain-containing protein [Ruminococcaceae bacterium]|nr:DUF2628 domain-containing protein [Oscillospiraceae bacterium]
MSSQEKSCVLCHAYLFPEDDVVYCPECGAPHHRECYNSIGKCALAEFHGTENQYDKIKKENIEEPTAETEQTQDEYQTPFGAYSPIDFLGGVKLEEQIADGVTAKQAANFVLSNTMRYIPKFKKLDQKNKNSWNFLAFLFPCEWFLSRKMYKNGFIVGFLEIIATLLMIPFYNMQNNLGITQALNTADMLERISQNMSKFSMPVMWVGFIGAILSLAICITVGIYGDWIYKKHTVKSIKEIEKTSEDKNFDYRKKGGVNIFMFFLGYVVTSYIPSIIAMFI